MDSTPLPSSLEHRLAGIPPILMFRKWKKGQSCATLWYRFGAGVPTLRKGPHKDSHKDPHNDLPKGEHPIIWLHAVSVGEMSLSFHLLRPSSLSLASLASSSLPSRTPGHAEAKRLLPEAACHLYLPLDLSFCENRVLSKIQPDLILLSEGDFWLNFLSKARAQGAHLVVVNGKLSSSSAKRYAQFPRFKEALFSLFSLFCLQNSLYKNQFSKLGIPQSNLKVAGNMKFESPLPTLTKSQKTALYEGLALAEDRPILGWDPLTIQKKHSC